MWNVATTRPYGNADAHRHRTPRSEETIRPLRMVGGIVRTANPTTTVGDAGRPEETSQMAAPQAYCVKCKTKREMSDHKQIEMKNGRPATEGKCSVCGTKMFKIGAT